ncbi:hypothetical protein ACS0TY_024347 [Phlomoides rotata]
MRLLSFLLDGIKELLSSGADVNFRDIDHRTVLHLAACQGYDDVAQFLLENGEKVDDTDRWGSTGVLHDYLKRKGALKPATALRLAMDIARGMNYLHEHRPEAIIHRDLEPSTIQDAIGSHVAWPVHLINLHIQTSQVSPNKNPNDHLTAQNFQVARRVIEVAEVEKRGKVAGQGEGKSMREEIAKEMEDAAIEHTHRLAAQRKAREDVATEHDQAITEQDQIAAERDQMVAQKEADNKDPRKDAGVVLQFLYYLAYGDAIRVVTKGGPGGDLEALSNQLKNYATEFPPMCDLEYNLLDLEEVHGIDLSWWPKDVSIIHPKEVGPSDVAKADEVIDLGSEGTNNAAIMEPAAGDEQDTGQADDQAANP